MKKPEVPEGPVIAVAYCRVSTDKQDNSLDAQEHKLRAMATVKEYKLLEVVVDSDEFSGDLKRPGVQRVIEMVKRGEVKAVLIAKLDRMTRSTRDVITLIELFTKKDCAFVSVAENLDTSSPMGRFFIRMMASIAELERETIGARTSEGLQNLKRNGLPAGHAPFGFTSQGAGLPLVRNEREQAIIGAIKIHRKAGSSLLEIATLFNDLGYVTRHTKKNPEGGPWKFQYVARILKDHPVEEAVTA